MMAGASSGPELRIQANISPAADSPLRRTIWNPTPRHSRVVSAIPISGSPSFSS
jgi:hypothetical protein